MRPPRWELRPVKGEEPFLARYGRLISYIARDVRHPARLGMERSDVVSDLRFCLLNATRKFVWSYRKLPPKAFVRVILHRRVCILNRNARVYARQVDRMPLNEEGCPIPVEELVLDDYDVEEDASEREREDFCAYLVGVLEEEMQPTEFALLIVRFTEELTPEEIGTALHGSGRQISQRLLRAKAAARSYLVELGIRSWRDVDHG